MEALFLLRSVNDFCNLISTNSDCISHNVSVYRLYVLQYNLVFFLFKMLLFSHTGTCSKLNVSLFNLMQKQAFVTLNFSL